MNNHTYRLKQETRLRSDGGNICNVLTGEVADAKMAWWKGQFMTIARKRTLHLMDKFILDLGLHIHDDDLAYNFLPPGTRWSSETRRMEIKPELVEEDLKQSKDGKIMQEVRKMDGSICPKLKTTFDCPDQRCRKSRLV